MGKNSILIVAIVMLTLASISCGGSTGTSVSTDETSESSSVDSSAEENENSSNTHIMQRLVYNFTDAAVIVSHDENNPDLNLENINNDLTDTDKKIVNIILDKITFVGDIDGAITVEEEVVTTDEESSDDIKLDVPAVESIVKSPSGEVYIVYKSLFKYDGENSCAFFKYIGDGGAECVDSDVFKIDDPVKNIQFDFNGSIFYYGDILINGAYHETLRKQSNTKEKTNITNENIKLYEYSLLSDGSVIAHGKTLSTSSVFLRHYTANSSVDDLLPSSSLYIHKLWSDSDKSVYYSGYWQGSSDFEYGIVQIEIDNSGLISMTPLLINTDINDDGDHDGYLVDNFYETDAGDIYFRESGSIFQLISDSPREVYSLSNITLTEIDGSTIYVAGQDDSASQTFFRYSLSNESEEDLFSSFEDEIEVYEFKIDDDGIVYFTGLRFSDNLVVVGQIDTENDNQVTYNMEIEEEPTIFEVIN